MSLFGTLWPKEDCKSCEVLKEQLKYLQEQNRELNQSIMELIKPKVIVPPEPVILNPTKKQSGTWSRRRAVLEEATRRESEILRSSPFLARPDGMRLTPRTVTELEEQLGVEEKEG